MLQIKIENTERVFRVHVYDSSQEIAVCGWQGTEFQYRGDTYAIYGPYHGFGDFRVYKLVPVTDPVLV